MNKIKKEYTEKYASEKCNTIEQLRDILLNILTYEFEGYK